MKCLRCDNEKTEAEMACKSKGKLRNWCKACDAARRRNSHADRIATMQSSVKRVSAELGRIITETGSAEWVNSTREGARGGRPLLRA